MGVKGKGVKLGIINAEITPNVKAFEKNYAHFYKFVSNNYNQIRYSSKCNSRGVMLAEIAVAKTNYFTGVAPKATLGTYRAFNCTNLTSASLVLEAIAAVIKDQMKIIVLPEIATVDENSTKLRQTIEGAAGKGVIIIVAATANNFVNQQYFSYRIFSVLSFGGARQDYCLSHWFEEKTARRRIEFMYLCLDMKYDFNNEIDIIPNFIGTLTEHFNGFEKGSIALIWY